MFIIFNSCCVVLYVTSEGDHWKNVRFLKVGIFSVLLISENPVPEISSHSWCQVNSCRKKGGSKQWK